ncbi:hypothetical protein DAI22_08g057300 [Oryza sativa Japonica Group]|nr:hypothetical protein DAI22_08g057300 [Oryza sativa Japonica Group]
MASPSSLCLLAALALISWQAMASDPSPLQDFCVADMHSPVRVNGFACLNPMEVNADHFFKAAKLDTPRKTNKNPPHTHPRATEILTVLEGTLYVGFVTSNPNNTLFSKVLNKGDVFVFPQGLIHFQFNPNPHQPAVAIAALSSQNPGAITIANAVFGSKPPISDEVLAKAFQVEKGTIDWLQAQFWENNHY